MKLKTVFLLIVFSLTSIYCQSQNVPLGQWSDYLSYQQALTVCEGGGNIYICCSSGVFSYNLSSGSIQRYNKVTGLSDIGCTVARYNHYTNTLVVGYSDGNIDLVTNNQVINIPDLKNSSTQGSKVINNIYFSNNLAYISCGQGILVVDLSQDIIVAPYYIGINGTVLNVYSTTIFNDTIFAATAKGIYKISVNDPNPNDYQDWQVVGQHLPSGVYNGIVNCGTKMYASFSRRLTSNGYNVDTLFVYNKGIWSHYNNVQGNDDIYSLESSMINATPYLVYSGSGNITAFDSSGKSLKKIFKYDGFTNFPSPNDAVLGNDTNFWIADGNYGLIKSFSAYSPAQSYIPSGPFSNDMFAIAAQGPVIYTVPGGYEQGEVPLYISNIGVSEYSDGSWYRLIDDAPKDTIYDLCCVAIDPKNPLHSFAGSYGEGVVEYNNNAITNVYDSYNSALPYFQGYPGICRIGGVAFDTMDNLWDCTSNAENSEYLSVKKNNGTWQSFSFNGIANLPLPVNGKVTNLISTKSGAVWIIFPGNGILAYQNNGTFALPNASNSVFINGNVGNGNLPSVDISCLAEDLNGAIWVGTSTQVVVFYSPDEVFNDREAGMLKMCMYSKQAIHSILCRDNILLVLLLMEPTVNGLGTQGGGVFLMSADGTQQILNFTTTNSPLISNNILSITIDQVNGEVFFGTDLGLVSYRGNATEGNATFTNVYAYPDPVPHGYSGTITIKNLVGNSDVKIATVSGEIVYHTIALGGQAIWYGTNFNGQRVQTGVYLVFCTSPDGTQSLVTKLLLVN